MSIYDGHNLVSAHEWHLHHVVKDETFQSRIDGIPLFSRLTREFVSDICNQYALTEQELHDAVNHELESSAESGSGAWPGIRRGENYGHITFDRALSREEDVVQLYREMTSGRELIYGPARPRRRGPNNHMIIYTIFRLLKAGNTYAQIFRLYQQENLPGYSGSYTQFHSQDSMERYYRKYRPD